MGQRSKPRLTKQGKKILCKTGNLLLLVVLGLSSNSGPSSFSTSLPQDSSSTSSSPAPERSDEPTPGNWRDSPEAQNKNEKKDINRSLDVRLRGLPEWLEATENLEDTEVPGPAHISHDSDSERPTTVALRKHSVYTHFSKDRSCEVCLRSKMTNVPCRRRTGEAVTRAEQFGDLITADHRDLNEEGESRNNDRYAVVVQVLPLNGDNLIRAKQKLPRRRTRVYESVSSRRKSRKSFTLTIHWNLANPVKIYHGIIELRHLIDLR